MILYSFEYFMPIFNMHCLKILSLMTTISLDLLRLFSQLKYGCAIQKNMIHYSIVRDDFETRPISNKFGNKTKQKKNREH